MDNATPADLQHLPQLADLLSDVDAEVNTSQLGPYYAGRTWLEKALTQQDLSLELVLAGEVAN